MWVPPSDQGLMSRTSVEDETRSSTHVPIDYSLEFEQALKASPALARITILEKKMAS